MIGKVKWFDSKDKWYGFLTGDDGKDVFFHQNNVDPERKIILKENQRVSYEISQDKKGREKAVDVKVIQ